MRSTTHRRGSTSNWRLSGFRPRRSTPIPRWPKRTPPAGQRRRRPRLPGVWGTGPAAWPALTWLHPGLGRWRHEPIRCCACAQIPSYPRRSPEAPFSVLFTGWLSMMAASGVASCPSFCRTWPRSSSSTRSQVPSARHLRKYHHTVPREAGHGAPFATVCRHAKRTVCRLPPPAGPRCAGDPGPAQGATRAPNAPIGNPSNRWDTSYDSYSQSYNLSPDCHQAIFKPLYNNSHTPS